MLRDGEKRAEAATIYSPLAVIDREALKANLIIRGRGDATSVFSSLDLRIP